MDLSNLKIAWRSIQALRFFSLLNVLGLASGMAAALLIFLWVQNELTFDTKHPSGDRTYRMITHIDVGEEVWHWATVPLRLSKLAKEDIPEIEKLTIGRDAFESPVVQLENGKLFEENNLLYVDQNWLSEFQYQIKSGSFEAFDKRKHSLALTTDLAEKYFGQDEAIGQIVRIDTTEYEVNLVLNENPTNSSFQFKAFMPLEAKWSKQSDFENEDNWSNFNYLTFVRLAENASPEDVSRKCNLILDEHREDNNATVSLERLSDLRFSQVVQGDVFGHQRKSSVLIFALIGLILLIAAGLNYTNLSTAILSKRMKEIGVKKIVGASFRNVFSQIMIETLLISLISFGFAIGIAEMMLPFIDEFTGMPLKLQYNQPTIWIMLAGTVALSACLSGIYPAVIFAGFRPLSLLQSKRGSLGSVSLRKLLVIVQFVVTITMLICTVIIHQQLKFIQQKDVGYNRSHVVRIQPNLYQGDWDRNVERFAVFEKEVSKVPEFECFAVSSGSPILIRSTNSGSFEWDGMPEDFEAVVSTLSADERLKEVFDFKMKMGRWFEEGRELDKKGIILNEAAIQSFQIAEPVIGRSISWQGIEGSIIGVVKDFHFRSMHTSIDPLLISYKNGWESCVLARISNTNVQRAIKQAEQSFAQVFPNQPFNYTFLDDAYDKMHQSEKKMSSMFKIFAGLLIFISCLGMFGLTTFAVERRTKEIGIRKVLGANVHSIVHLLSKEFVKLTVIGIVVSIPLGWLLMNQWLKNYAYRIELSWWMFALAGVMVIFLALLTTSFQSIRAALNDPVGSLRNE
jgi:ABC-type antimicrobial peptide transport system permease subunit